MRLFSKHRPAAAEPGPVRWRPLSEDWVPLSGDAADMDDAGQAYPFAWQVAFGCGHRDCPVITVCTYVAYGGEEGTFCLGLRYRYTSEAHPGWSYTGWTADPAGVTFGSIPDAAGGASWWASRLGMAAYVDTLPAPPEVFGWDGEVFPCGS